jgi:hypothetical protein
MATPKGAGPVLKAIPKVSAPPAPTENWETVEFGTLTA